MISVIVPDGSKFELEDGATAHDLAKQIGKKLAKAALAAKVNGNFTDLTTTLNDGDQVTILTFDDAEGKEVFWHSSAHVLAQAVKRLYPNAKPTIGPAIEEGFFYDFADLQVSEDDFPAIEAEVVKITRENIAPERVEYDSQADAIEAHGDNPFKKELIEGLEEGLSAYRQAEFVDLCRGPHLPHLSKIGAMKLMKTSGAYWRGNAENEQLTRIYGISFPDKKELKQYIHRLEEAKKRDHRVLGKKLGLFAFHKEAPGLPFIYPNGMIVWNELLSFWRDVHDADGYAEIKTPGMMNRELWEKSGHWANYRENMYTSEIEDKIFAIKPMNCPGGMMFFGDGQYSYRDLPLKVAEIGNVYRHEMSGALSGMFRVRSFHQDDAHIFMETSQIKDQVLGVIALAEKIYAQFDLDFNLELSTKPEKAIGSDEDWEAATEGLRQALEASGRDYKLNPGDGAFYGPKIDFHLKDAIGRTWQCGTIQLDFSLPDRFDLTYIQESGERARPIMVHRALFGSIERFFGILVEHYAGKFPLWMSPRQVRLIPVAEKHGAFAEEFAARLRSEGLRVGMESFDESVPKRVRKAQLDQVNYILVLGDQEMNGSHLAVRTRDNVVHNGVDREQFIAQLKEEFSTRAKQSTLKS